LTPTPTSFYYIYGTVWRESERHAKGWDTVIPTEAWGGGIIAAVITIGAIAGLLPALRAAPMSPTQALWSM
jgi:ABC-type antimicrobial peptide transport system permease subunit